MTQIVPPVPRSTRRRFTRDAKPPRSRLRASPACPFRVEGCNAPVRNVTFLSGISVVAVGNFCDGKKNAAVKGRRAEVNVLAKNSVHRNGQLRQIGRGA